MAQSPRRSRHLQGLDPLPLQSEDDTRPALHPTSVYPPEIDRENTSQSTFEIRSEDSHVSTPIPDPSGLHSVDDFAPDLAETDYSVFSFEPYTPVSINNLTPEVN